MKILAHIGLFKNLQTMLSFMRIIYKLNTQMFRKHLKKFQ